jgi:hypothetical protein
MEFIDWLLGDLDLTSTSEAMALGVYGIALHVAIWWRP